MPSSLCFVVAPVLHLAKLPPVLGSWLFYAKLLMLHINQCDSLDAHSRTWVSALAVDRLVYCKLYFWCRYINGADTRTSGLLLFLPNHIWSTRPVVSLNSLPPIVPLGEVTRACNFSASMTGLSTDFFCENKHIQTLISTNITHYSSLTSFSGVTLGQVCGLHCRHSMTPPMMLWELTL